MFKSSCDILLIVLAVAIAAMAIFACIAMYYMIMILKRGRELTQGWSDRFQRIDEILNLIKEKLASTSSYLALFGEGIKYLMEFLKKKRGEEEKK